MFPLIVYNTYDTLYTYILNTQQVGRHWTLHVHMLIFRVYYVFTDKYKLYQFHISGSLFRRCIWIL